VDGIAEGFPKVLRRFRALIQKIKVLCTQIGLKGPITNAFKVNREGNDVKDRGKIANFFRHESVNMLLKFLRYFDRGVITFSSER